MNGFDGKMQQSQAAYLVLTNYAPEDWSHRVRPGVPVIGRSRTANIQLPKHLESVSRRHAELRVDSLGMQLRDLKSSAGTRVNGIWIGKDRPVRIAIGDRLQLGSAEVRIVAESPELNAPPADDDSDGDECETHLIEKRGGLRIQTLLERLSPAELEVMLWMCRGHTTNHELAAVLSRSPETVRTQVGKILEKLELHSRAEIMCWFPRAALGRAVAMEVT